MDDDDDHAMEFHDDDDVGDNICVQHVMNTVLTYGAHGPSFHANIWDNIVDPLNVEIPFSSSWMRGMNFSKGFAATKIIFTSARLSRSNNLVSPRSNP